MCLFLAAAAALLKSATVYGVWLIFETFGRLAGLAVMMALGVTVGVLAVCCQGIKVLYAYLRRRFARSTPVPSTNSIEDEEKRIKAKAGHVDEKKDCVRGDENCNSTDQLLPQAGKLGTSMSSGDAHIDANTS